jgi:DNA modification methylase
MSDHHGRVELTWTDKDRALLTHENGSYEWVPPHDRRVAEVRLLKDAGTVGEVAPEVKRATDNLLVRGDALHALTALLELPEFAKEYVGKVKLIYIDPPFNTDQLFKDYDDNLEHSVWLTMMRDRLDQAKKLLRDEGTVWVHLDDEEVHRCRSVLDEVFGLDCFLGTVIWQKADGPRNDLPNFSVDHDYILVYGKTPSAKLNQTERADELNAIYKSPDGDSVPWYDGDPTAPSAQRNQTWVYAVQSPVTGELMYPAKGRCWATKQETVLTAMREWADYELKVLDDDERRADICGVSVEDVRKGIPAIVLATDLETARETTRQRKEAGPWPEYIIRSKGTLGYKRLQPERGSNVRTIWFNDEVGHNREGKGEIKALFPEAHPFSTPKPERLLRKIIEASTEPGEIVLDCFAGSGTTAAVAHKLGRRWVTIELKRETVEAFLVPRLEKVVHGRDDGGITTTETRTSKASLPEGTTAEDAASFTSLLKKFSDVALKDGVVAKGAGDENEAMRRKAVQDFLKALRQAAGTRIERATGWTGGGGFRILEVSPSMYVDDEGIVVIADWAVADDLAEAVAAQLGFSRETMWPFAGKKGRSRLAVIDGHADEHLASALLTELPDGESLTLCAISLDPELAAALPKLRRGSKARLVPEDLLLAYAAPSRWRAPTTEAPPREKPEPGRASDASQPPDGGEL